MIIWKRTGMVPLAHPFIGEFFFITLDVKIVTIFNLITPHK